MREDTWLLGRREQMTERRKNGGNAEKRQAKRGEGKMGDLQSNRHSEMGDERYPMRAQQETGRMGAPETQ